MSGSPVAGDIVNKGAGSGYEKADSVVILTGTQLRKTIDDITYFKLFGRRQGIVKLREIPALSRRKRSALERRINNLETAMKHS